jgi:hypothetical protein
VVAVATTDADDSGYADGQQIGNDECRLDTHFDGGRPEHLGAMNDKATLSTHVGLPALYVKMVGTVDFQYHPTTIVQFPLSVEVAKTSM